MAKRKQNVKKVLVLRGGTEVRVIGETGRYWICENAQFKKNSAQIVKVLEEKQSQEEITEGVDEICRS